MFKIIFTRTQNPADVSVQYCMFIKTSSSVLFETHALNCRFSLFAMQFRHCHIIATLQKHFSLLYACQQQKQTLTRNEHCPKVFLTVSQGLQVHVMKFLVHEMLF